MTEYLTRIVCEECKFTFDKTLQSGEDRDIEHLSCPKCKKFKLYVAESEIIFQKFTT